MTPSVLDRIPTMDRMSLRTLLENARARPHVPGAAAIVAAAEEALKPKGPSKAPARPSLTDAEREAIRERWKDAPTVERIAAAFKDLPLTEAQVRRLRILHEHPDLDENALAGIAGDDGPGAFNLVLGALARDRLDYLLEPDGFAANGQPQWSSTICILRKRIDDAGRVTHGWNLKPETIEAMRRVGYL